MNALDFCIHTPTDILKLATKEDNGPCWAIHVVYRLNRYAPGETRWIYDITETLNVLKDGSDFLSVIEDKKIGLLKVSTHVEFIKVL